ncbi:MAG: transglutaminase-like domain-containing protein [Phycisphaerales bacterium]|nr:transglutaminase-like domain-containing protein [Phycisphaerales bacterium]
MFAVVSGCVFAANALAGVSADSPSQSSAVAPPIPHTVTADIQAGIEAHIAAETKKGGGYFPLTFEGKGMKLRLVRVHTEYLANLGPGRHFACVDLASIDGNVYDVDFFLEGEPGNMTVTETTVHKLNGRPFYLWRQQDDGTWAHADVDDASQELLGVIEGDDEFEFVYHATVPELTGPGRMWIPMPESDAFQTVQAKSISIPGTRRVLTDKNYGNKVLFVELTPADSGKAVSMVFDVKRREKGVYGCGEEESPAQYLLPERLVPNTTEFKEIAMEALKNKRGGDLVKARALYDHTIDRMQYIKADQKYGKGDAQYACDGGTGNCTDYHSYFIALARSVGIPARFAIGAAIPSSRDDGGVNGYHCWAEFYAEGKWWPVDISEADKYTSLATYYFGHNPANRLELSRGRDLMVEPGPVSGPINFLAYPVLEVNGESIKVDKPKFGFTRKS